MVSRIEVFGFELEAGSSRWAWILRRSGPAHSGLMAPSGAPGRIQDESQRKQLAAGVRTLDAIEVDDGVGCKLEEPLAAGAAGSGRVMPLRSSGVGWRLLAGVAVTAIGHIDVAPGLRHGHL